MPVDVNRIFVNQRPHTTKADGNRFPIALGFPRIQPASDASVGEGDEDEAKRREEMPLHPHGAKRLERERHVRHNLIGTRAGEDVISGRKRAFPTAGPLLHGSVPVSYTHLTLPTNDWG